uniref:Orf36 n=1 Tax=Daucus carota subsp. sativus TaxID=79200 RepID=I1TIE4_DAUCS|nr:orf36 [Daucus carota subsp. sativus]AEY81174.1 orf36 [Daucus carota subsp. sativus]
MRKRRLSYRFRLGTDTIVQIPGLKKLLEKVLPRWLQEVLLNQMIKMIPFTRREDGGSYFDYDSPALHTANDGPTYHSNPSLQDNHPSVPPMPPVQDESPPLHPSELIDALIEENEDSFLLFLPIWLDYSACLTQVLFNLHGPLHYPASVGSKATD